MAHLGTRGLAMFSLGVVLLAWLVLTARLLREHRRLVGAG